MLKITGRLVSKSLLKTGVNEFGTWRIIEFAIQRTYRKKKVVVAMKAFGARADVLDSIEFNERITVVFIPECKYSEKYHRFFTELKAIEVEKYVPKKNDDIYVNDVRLNESDYNLNQNNEIKFPPIEQ